MTTEPDPALDDAPLQATLDAEAAAAEKAARPPRPPLDQRTQLAVGSGLAVAIIGLLGTVIGAWSLAFSGVILIAAGLVAAGAAYLSSTPPRSARSVALRDLILAGGTISAALGILFVAEILFDTDDLDTYGGVLGLILTIALGIAGVVLYVAATRWWSGGPAAPWTTVIPSADRATKMVLIGTGLVLVGWLGNVTIGFWFLEAGAEVITFVLLAALLMRAAADPAEPMRLPLPASFGALALALIAAIIAIQHTSALLDQGAGLDNWIAQVLYVAGVAIVLAGAGLGAAEDARTFTEGSKGTTPPA